MGGERGSAVILVIIMILLLSSLGTTLLMLSKTDMQIAANHRDGIAAQYLAEAGIQQGITKLKNDNNFVEQTKLGLQVITSEYLGTIPTGGSYTVKTGPDFTTTNVNTRLITAIGIVNQAKRQVSANITLPDKATENSPFIIIWNN